MKRMKSKIAASFLIAAMMTTEAMAAVAPISPEHIYAAYENGIVPYWNDTAMVQVTISAKGTSLTPILAVETYDDSTKTSGSMYLEKYSSGKWVKVKTWSVSKTGSFVLTKSYTGTAGTEYRTRVVLKIGNDSIEEACSGYEI